MLTEVKNMHNLRWANDALAITPSDTVRIEDANSNPVNAILFVGGSGNVTVITAYGTTVLFTGVTAGTVIPVEVSQVKATGTTATDIVGMFIS